MNAVAPTMPHCCTYYHNAAACSRCYEFFSKNSFASLTLVAKYGLPPRSGWFNSMRVRCAFRIFSFDRARSLFICQPLVANVPVSTSGHRSHILERQNERGFSLVHPRFESALVKCLSERANASARSSPRNKSCSALLSSR